MSEWMTYFDAGALARQGRVSQARFLAEVARPYVERWPDLLGPYAETLRRFGAGEFVPRAELEQAAARIRVALQLMHLAEQGHLAPLVAPESPLDG